MLDHLHINEYEKTEIPFGSEQTDLDRSPLESGTVLSRPIWRELRTFLAVAKSPSFAKAAEMLGTSAPTVSRDVKRLEDQMGSHLVISTFAGVTLTETGQKLALEISRLDFQLFALSNNIQEEADTLSGRVSVSVTSGLAVAMVGTNVSKLNEDYPRINLDIKEQVSLVNFEKNQAEIMVSLAPIYRPDIACHQIGTLHLIPMASSHYVKHFGVPQHTNCQSHVFLQCTYYGSKQRVWRDWNTLIEKGHQTHYCENSLAYYALIRSGAGIGLLGNYVLADTELVPLELGIHVALPIYLITVANQLRSKPIAAVYNWLQAIFKSNSSFDPDLTFPSGQSESDKSLQQLLPIIAS